MLSVASASIEKDQSEQYSMRFQDHPAVQRKDMFQVDPRKLKVDPGYNVRGMDSKDTREHIAGLKASIIANGVKVPLEVRMGERDQIFIVSGHCRQAAVLEAIKEGAEIATVPCVLEKSSTNEIDRTVNLIVANSGKPLAPLEVAAVVKRLDDYGWNAKQIAERLGWKSTNTVKHHLEMAALSEDDKKKVRDRKVSATTARQMAKGISKEEADRLWRENEEENKRLTGKGKKERKLTPRAVKKAKEAAKPRPAPETDSAREPQVPTSELPPVLDPRPPVTRTLTDEEKRARAEALEDARQREAADTDQHVTDEAAPYSETVSLLIALTREANSILAHNKSDDNPGYWTREFEDAIQDARAHIEQITGKPMEFETLPDAAAQVAEEV